MGIPISNPESNRENCPKISSACVIWQGPNIPCINLCAGDAIDEVVFKLATYLCELSNNIFDVEAVDFDCLLEGVTVVPSNLQETIQLLINNLCNASTNSLSLKTATIVGETPTGELILELPSCLTYTNTEGDLVQVLPESEYVTHLATKLCEVIFDINDLKSKISSMETAIVTMQARLNVLSNFDGDIYIVSQCASNFETDKQVLIQDAFSYLERNYCNLSTAVGTPTSIYNTINNQIPNLSNLPQLMNNGLLMKKLPNWINNTSTLAETVSNVWLTVSDMRSKIIEIVNNTIDNPCILLPPENLEIGTIGDVSSQITWNKTSVENVISPTGYTVQVFALTDTTFSTPLFSQSKSQIDELTNSMTIASENIDTDVEYIVHVKAIYNCGLSNAASLKTKLRAATVLYYVSPTVTDTTLAEASCTDIEDNITLYDPVKSEVYFSLFVKSTGLPVINNGDDINVVVRFEIESCEYAEPVYEDVTFVISNGSDKSNTIEYLSSKKTNCSNGITCGNYTKIVKCGVYISNHFVEFEAAKITVCE